MKKQLNTKFRKVTQSLFNSQQAYIEQTIQTMIKIF